MAVKCQYCCLSFIKGILFFKENPYEYGNDSEYAAQTVLLSSMTVEAVV
ncbi:hypothetical protein [Paenibacillus sp. RC67]|nr:hypothetical protein [Paenibacillus sp. RC67]